MAETRTEKVARQLAGQATEVAARRDAEKALTHQLRGERYITNDEAWYLLDLIADLRRAAAAAAVARPVPVTRRGAA